MNVRNYIHLTGNLGGTPTTYVLPGGDLSCRFTLATNEYYRDKDGQRNSRTEWHTVKAYGKLAELFAQYLEKGSAVSIVGPMRYRKWEDKFGQKRISPEVIAEEFTFLNSPRPEQGDPAVTVFPNPEAAAAADADAPDPAAAEDRPAGTRTGKKTATRRKKTAKQPAA